MAGRSANTNRNGGFYPRLANLLQRNLCARISSAGNCDRFLHTYRIPQAVPRILGIPDGSRASRRKKKRKRGGEATRGGEERSGNDKDKGGGGQEVSAPLLRPFRKSPGMRAMPLYRVSLFLSL